MFVDEGAEDDYKDDPVKDIEKQSGENCPIVEWFIKRSTAVNTILLSVKRNHKNFYHQKLTRNH